MIIYYWKLLEMLQSCNILWNDPVLKWKFVENYKYLGYNWINKMHTKDMKDVHNKTGGKKCM